MQIDVDGITQGTHIEFHPAPPKPKTKVWWIVSKYDTNMCLGAIGWFPRWRKYSFFPNPDTVYEQVCLREIAEFCETQTKRHKEQA